MFYRSQIKREEPSRVTEINENLKQLGAEPFYVVLASKKMIASYLWNGSRLDFICLSRFSSRMELSRSLKQTPGRRNSDKQEHHQGLDGSERHCSENTAMKDFMRLHLDSLNQAIQNKKLPFFYQAQVKVLSDQSNQDAILSAFEKNIRKHLSFIPSNILAKFKKFEPQHSRTIEALSLAIAKSK